MSFPASCVSNISALPQAEQGSLLSAQCGGPARGLCLPSALCQCTFPWSPASNCTSNQYSFTPYEGRAILSVILAGYIITVFFNIRELVSDVLRKAHTRVEVAQKAVILCYFAPLVLKFYVDGTIDPAVLSFLNQISYELGGTVGVLAYMITCLVWIEMVLRAKRFNPDMERSISRMRVLIYVLFVLFAVTYMGCVIGRYVTIWTRGTGTALETYFLVGQQVSIGLDIVIIAPLGILYSVRLGRLINRSLDIYSVHTHTVGPDELRLLDMKRRNAFSLAGHSLMMLYLPVVVALGFPLIFAPVEWIRDGTAAKLFLGQYLVCAAYEYTLIWIYYIATDRNGHWRRPWALKRPGYPGLRKEATTVSTTTISSTSSATPNPVTSSGSSGAIAHSESSWNARARNLNSPEISEAVPAVPAVSANEAELVGVPDA